MPRIEAVKIEDLKTHPEKKVDVPDLAEYWGVHKSTIYRLADKGAFPVARIGRRIKVDRAGAYEFEQTSGRPVDEHESGQAK